MTLHEETALAVEVRSFSMKVLVDIWEKWLLAQGRSEEKE